MATASPSESSLECPICHEDFDDPKILPCTHLACKKCVLSWFCNSGGEGGCPICRAPILPSNFSAEDDLVMLVDTLPTNFAIMALVENQKVLSSPHECGLCDDVTSTSYCLECNVKLCTNCAKGHKKIPSTKNHVTEDLSKVTAERLAETNRIMCKAHPDRLGELYCPAHKEVICILCIGTSHESCTDKKSIADAADEERAKFKDRACALRQSETTIAQQIKDVKDAYKVVRKRVKATFDYIQKTTEKRRQELEREIQAQEDAAMTAIKSKDTTRASLASNANTLEQSVSTAPQAALLAMAADLTSRLDQLQSHTATTTAGQLQVPEFTVDGSTFRQLKSDISSLGQITKKPQGFNSTTATPAQSTSAQAGIEPRAKRARLYTSSRTSPNTASSLVTSSGATSSSQAASPQPTSSQPTSSQPTSSQTGPKPRRAELVMILKVGDRVKPAPQYLFNYFWKKPVQQGTVTSFPSRARGFLRSGWVDVRWDGVGEDDCCRMGDGGWYELDLV